MDNMGRGGIFDNDVSAVSNPDNINPSTNSPLLLQQDEEGMMRSSNEDVPGVMTRTTATSSSSRRVFRRRGPILSSLGTAAMVLGGCASSPYHHHHEASAFMTTTTRRHQLGGGYGVGNFFGGGTVANNGGGGRLFFMPITNMKFQPTTWPHGAVKGPTGDGQKAALSLRPLFQQSDQHETNPLLNGSSNRSSEGNKFVERFSTPPLISAADDLIKDQPNLTPQEKELIFVEEEVGLGDVYERAVSQTIIWVFAACLFGLGLYTMVSHQTGEEFFAGYIVEQSLSVDNLFVFLLLFEYFNVPLRYQNRVLNWGIFGAVVMRAVMIGLGAAALENFHAILLVFAGFLVYSCMSTLGGFLGGDDDDGEDDTDMGEDMIVRFSRRLFPSTNYFDGDRFFTFVDGVRMATPLLLCMVAVEISDVVFAVDSIPAVFGVTENPLVVFSSNMFAIMGLRSLYTVLSKAAKDLEFLEPAVAVVLGFIGSKMIAEYFGFIIPTMVSLAVVSGLLTTGVGASVWKKRTEEAAASAALLVDGEDDSAS